MEPTVGRCSIVFVQGLGVECWTQFFAGLSAEHHPAWRVAPNYAEDPPDTWIKHLDRIFSEAADYGAQIHVAGFSLGSYTILRWLSERPEGATLPHRVVLGSVSPRWPEDLVPGSLMRQHAQANRTHEVFEALCAAPPFADTMQRLQGRLPRDVVCVLRAADEVPEVVHRCQAVANRLGYGHVAAIGNCSHQEAPEHPGYAAALTRLLLAA